MNEIIIDLSNNTEITSNRNIGYQYDHNKTKLKFKLPENDQVKNYSLVFDFSNGTIKAKEAIEDDDVITKSQLDIFKKQLEEKLGVTLV